MQVISGGATSQTFYKTLNRTYSSSGQGKRKLRKKIRKQHYEFEDGDEDEGYEKTITKTKITIVKNRKNKGKGHHHAVDGSDEYEYEYEDDGDGMEIQQIIGVYSLYLSNDVNVMHRTPKPASCMIWNGNKIKTFDGLVYGHSLYCAHTLLQDIVDGSFSIVLRACPVDSDVQCYYALDIYLQNIKYSIEINSKCDIITILCEEKSLYNIYMTFAC